MTFQSEGSQNGGGQQFYRETQPPNPRRMSPSVCFTLSYGVRSGVKRSRNQKHFLSTNHKMEAEKTKQVTLAFGRFLERGQISRKLELEKVWERL